MEDAKIEPQNEEQRNNKRISFNIGEESYPKIEKMEDVETSYFRDVYLKAFSLIDKMVESSMQPFDPLRKSREFSKIKTTQKSEERNNIIAFIGERGAGKTSCMFTVRSILEQLAFKRNEEINHLEWIKEKIYIRKTHFQALEVIDPSYFEKENNILEIIISKMFKEFKNDAQNPSRRLDCEDVQYVEKKRKLIRCFQEVKDSLDEIKKKRDKSNDSIEELSKMASSLELKEQIQDLVKSYLDYFAHKEDILLIAVDDIDLQTHYAGIMIEQIRKYLIAPNIIILLAVKLNQLTDIIKQDFYAAYKTLIEQEKVLSDSISEMTERYLTKFLPYENRLYLPDLKLNMDIILEIRTKFNLESYALNIFILKLLKEKLNLTFYNQKSHPSFIIPLNLRALLNFISMVYNMEGQSTFTEREYNRYLFAQYFFENWCKENMRKDAYNFLYQIREENAITLNKSVIMFLLNFYPQVFEGQGTHAEIERHNKYYNVSLGDVLWTLKEIEDYYNTVEVQKEIFAIKTLYSLKLEEAYNSLSKNHTFRETAFQKYLGQHKPEENNKQNQRPDKDVYENNESDEYTINFLEYYSDYECILNGNIFPEDIKNFCVGDKTTYPKAINGNMLNSLFQSLMDIVEKDSSLPNSTQYVKVNLDDKTSFNVQFKTALNTWEFYILNLSIGSDIYKEHYREKGTCYFNYLPYSLGVKSRFDITSIFFNLAKYYRYWLEFSSNTEKYYYGRKANFFRKIMNYSSSLFYQLYKNSSSIRPFIYTGNIETLEKLAEKLIFSFNSEEYLAGDNPKFLSAENKIYFTNIEILRAYYDKVINFRLPNYDLKGKEILQLSNNFKSLSPLFNYLESIITKQSSEKENTFIVHEAFPLFIAIYNSADNA